MPISLPPPPTTNGIIDRWLNLLWRKLSADGELSWGSIGFTGSNLTSIATRNHADLQNINTSAYTHLTQADHTDLTDGGATTLHKHDHGTQDGLGDDDHTQYLLASGSRALTGPIRLQGYTVATLPTAGTAGRVAYVTDATAPTYLGALTGGGAVVCKVFDNGTAWVSC